MAFNALFPSMGDSFKSNMTSGMNGTGASLHNEIVSKFPGIASQFETTMKTAVGSITATNATTGQQYQVQTLTVPASQTSSYVNPTSTAPATSNPVPPTPSASNPVVTVGATQGTSLNYTSAQWSAMDANARQQLVNSGQVYTVGGVQYKNGSVYDPSKYGNTGEPVVINNNPVPVNTTGNTPVNYAKTNVYISDPAGGLLGVINQVDVSSGVVSYNNKSYTVSRNSSGMPYITVGGVPDLDRRGIGYFYEYMYKNTDGTYIGVNTEGTYAGMNNQYTSMDVIGKWLLAKGLSAMTTYNDYRNWLAAGSNPLPNVAPYLWKGGKALTSGLAWVGERGPELMALPKGAEVMPHTPSMDLLAKQTKPQVIDKSVHYHIDGNTFQVSGKDERQLFEEFMKLMERESRRVRG
jgi:hypothetical protein